MLFFLTFYTSKNSEKKYHSFHKNKNIDNK